MKTIPRALISGFLATGPMTFALLRSFEELPEGEKSPLPPATITTDMLKKVGIQKGLGPDGKVMATLAAHFAYGAVTALPYSAFLSKRKEPVLVKGALYGLAVWGGSYMGLLPSLGVRSTAVRMPLSRNLMMIGAHLVWGAAVAYSDAVLEKMGNDMLRGERKSPRAE